MNEKDQSTVNSPRGLAIVPAFNESASIARVVSQIYEHLPDFVVLVVDDGSVDDTAARVPNGARIVRLPFNMGIGSAMQTGYRYAVMNGFDFAVQIDGDGQHPPGQVPKLVAALLRGDADMVIGSRFLETIKYRQSFSRMVGIHWLRQLIHLLTGQWIKDPTSGFRGMNRQVLEAFACWYPADYPEPEVLVLLHQSGFRIKEVQVEMEQRQAGRTSIPFLRGLFYVVKVSVAILLGMIRQPWPEQARKRPSAMMDRSAGLADRAAPSAATDVRADAPTLSQWKGTDR